jgi:hypothetical protein
MRSADRNWGQTLTASHSRNWSDTESRSRVYEYAVEPQVLQQLPDYAMVLVEHSAGGIQVKAVEINPDIPLLQQADADQASQLSSIAGDSRQSVEGAAAADAIGPWPKDVNAVTPQAALPPADRRQP